MHRSRRSPELRAEDGLCQSLGLRGVIDSLERVSRDKAKTVRVIPDRRHLHIDLSMLLHRSQAEQGFDSSSFLGIVEAANALRQLVAFISIN